MELETEWVSLKEGTLAGLCVFWCFCVLLLCLVNVIYKLNRMINQLVSNIEIFAQKSKVFNRHLHLKDHAPSSLCLSTYEEAWSLVSHPWKFTDCTHTAKRCRSALFHGGSLFWMWRIHDQTCKPIDTENICPSVCLQVTEHIWRCKLEHQIWSQSQLRNEAQMLQHWYIFMLISPTPFFHRCLYFVTSPGVMYTDTRMVLGGGVVVGGVL